MSEEKRAETVKVDFRHRDTEAGWAYRIDKYALILVPAWFNVLGWIALLAGMEFLRVKSKSMTLGVLIGVSIFCLWFYFIAVFFRAEFVGILPNRFARFEPYFSSITSGLLSYGAYRLSLYAVELIAKATSP